MRVENYKEDSSVGCAPRTRFINFTINRFVYDSKLMHIIALFGEFKKGMMRQKTF